MAKVQGTLSYQCQGCRQPEKLFSKDTATAPVKRVHAAAFDSKLCISCYCDNHIAAAAENVTVFL